MQNLPLSVFVCACCLWPSPGPTADGNPPPGRHPRRHHALTSSLAQLACDVAAFATVQRLYCAGSAAGCGADIPWLPQDLVRLPFQAVSSRRHRPAIPMHLLLCWRRCCDGGSPPFCGRITCLSQQKERQAAKPPRHHPHPCVRPPTPHLPIPPTPAHTGRLPGAEHAAQRRHLCAAPGLRLGGPAGGGGLPGCWCN